ncbi:MAG: response regulator transcription factor [Candidatus Omnitrophica bacterium]|nr:response regulator transcription factor [Candidatus Omnitrophota bacterium]
MKSIVISGFNEIEYIQKSIAAGAKGYFLKDDPAENIIQAIRSVYQGKVYYSDEVLSLCAQNTLQPSNANDAVNQLTRREIAIFELLGKGYRRHQIAQELKISVKTVSQHIENIKSKFNLKTTDEIYKLALQLNNEK